MKLFQKHKPNCFFCNIEIVKKDMFVIEYKSAEGVGKVNVCPICAKALDKIIDDRNMTFDD